MAGLDTVLAQVIGEPAARAVLGGATMDESDRCIAAAYLERMAILDPACGSGAFLVHLLERVADLRRQLGDARPLSVVRRDVLSRSIFGVDVNPTAAWLCELRLWLSVVIESDEADPTRVSPLPNLDHNIRVGDALAGRAFDDLASAPRVTRDVETARRRYAGATGRRKLLLAQRLDDLERAQALRDVDTQLASVASRRKELVMMRRGRDLFGDRTLATSEQRATSRTLRTRASELRALRRRVAAGGALPFSFASHFADVGARGGFDLIVGNPPWVRLHRLPMNARATFRRDFAVARSAAWEPGAGSAGAGRGFAAQIDLAALFVERSLRLLAPRATLALLVPAKLWQSLAGGGVRRLLSADANLRRLEDYSEAPAAFDAAVYPSLVVATRRDPSEALEDARVALVEHHRGAPPVEWCASARDIRFDDTPGAPWLILPPLVRTAFDALRSAGQPLAETRLGRPHLGVKCGCNDAFVVRVTDVDGDLANVTARDGRAGLIERALLRPLIRGEDLTPWESTQHVNGSYGRTMRMMPRCARCHHTRRGGWANGGASSPHEPTLADRRAGGHCFEPRPRAPIARGSCGLISVAHRAPSYSLPAARMCRSTAAMSCAAETTSTLSRSRR
jgi:hypothetical protein